MNIRFYKSVDIQEQGVVKAFTPGSTIELQDDKARKLIAAGYAESIEPTSEDYRAVITDFGKLDPGAGCWQFIQKHRPDLWRSHTQAIRESDLSKAATTFKAMLEAWNQRHNISQSDLLAA